MGTLGSVRFWQQWRGTINIKIKQPWKIIRTFLNVFLRFFWISKKTWLSTFSWVVAHVFSNTVDELWIKDTVAVTYWDDQAPLASHRPAHTFSSSHPYIRDSYFPVRHIALWLMGPYAIIWQGTALIAFSNLVSICLWAPVPLPNVCEYGGSGLWCPPVLIEWQEECWICNNSILSFCLEDLALEWMF